MPTHTLKLSLAGLVLMAALGSPVFAGSPIGTWLRSNGAHISVFNCGGGIGMRVVKSPEPHKVGKLIMCGAKKTGANKWKGSLLNLDDGQTYSGYVTLKDSRLSLSGCVLAGLICKTDTWSRLK